MVDKADWEYYKALYPDTEPLLEEVTFCRNIGLMYEIIAYMTMQRIRTQSISDELTERIKQAACRAAEVWEEKNASDGIVSENNDGYSVTYSDKRKTARAAAEDTIKIYLADTGLLYRGNQ